MTKEEKRMEEMVKQFQIYVATYSNQLLYKTYSDETFLDDMLYGIGLTFGKEHEFASGYEIWKEKLKNFLTKRTF